MDLYVNNERIDPELIEGEFRAIKSQAESLGNMSCCERDPEFRSMARENVVARVLLNQESQRRDLEVTAEEIDSALARIETEHGGREKLLENLGLHSCQLPEVRADIANGLRVEKTLRACLGPLPEPDESELRAYYESHQADYLTEEEMRATHLFKQVQKVEDRQRLYDELRALRRRVHAGEDFAPLAHEHTDKEDKLTDLGWFKQREFMDEFSTIVFSLEENEMSPVFPSYFGLHLAQCTGRRPPVPRPFDEVRDDVLQQLITEDQHQKSREWVELLKKQATIEERDKPSPATT